MDWRVDVFSDKVIMTVMNKYLTLRDVGVITALCNWSVDWRETMTMVLNMRNRIALRWPHGLYFTPEEGLDLIALLQQKARQALLPVSTLRFECWMCSCKGRHNVSSIQLVSQEAMPYASCHNCARDMAPRHMISTHSPYNYIWARLTRTFKEYSDGSMIRQNIADAFVRDFMNQHVNQKTYALYDEQPHLCAELEVSFSNLVREHDLHVAWDEFCAIFK